MKNKLLRHLKRGFGAVEVILLLTVVAILATFAFITVDQIKKKPITYTETNTVYVKDDPDYLTIDAINAYLKNKKFESVHETVTYLETKGYAAGKLTPQSKSYEFVYSKKDNLFLVVSNKTVIYPTDKSSTPLDQNIWRFISKSSVNLENFSYYLLDEFEGTISSRGGVDVGNNEDVTEINIINTTYTDELLVRTNNVTNNITINATKGTVKHLGNAGKVTIMQVPYNCYYEYGKTIYLNIQKGKVVAKEGGYINLVYVTRNTAALTEDGGHIEQACCVSTEEAEMESDGYNNFSERYGGNVYINFINPETSENYKANDIRLFGSELVNNAAKSTSFEGVLVSDGVGNKLLTLENFAKKVNAGEEFEGYEVTMLGDVDLKNVSNWTPMKLFKGTFDGKNHIIRNLTINSSATSTGVGLFASFSEPAAIKNVNLKGASITAPTSNSHVGGLIGVVRSGVSVSNCSIDSTSNLIGGNVGGLVGTVAYTEAESQFSVDSCSVSATLVGNNAGGLIGRIQTSLNNQPEIYSTTLIENCTFDGKLLGNTGKICYLGGLVGDEIRGDNLSKLVINSCNVDGVIKGNNDDIASFIIGKSTYRYHLKDVRIKGEELTNPSSIGGVINGKALLISVDDSLFVADNETEGINALPNFLSEKSVFVVSEDLKVYKTLQNKEFDSWLLVGNLELNDDYSFSYKIDENINYVGFNPINFIDKQTSKVQQRRYVAGHDNTNDCDIYKFDMYRIVEVDFESETTDEWMDKLTLEEGVYFDNPSEYVDKEMYEITTYELEDYKEGFDILEYNIENDEFKEASDPVDQIEEEPIEAENTNQTRNNSEIPPITPSGENDDDFDDDNIDPDISNQNNLEEEPEVIDPPTTNIIVYKVTLKE